VLLTNLSLIARSGRRRGSRPGHERSRRAFSILGALACSLAWQSNSPPALAQETPATAPATAQATDRVLVIPLESTVPDAQADVVLAFNLALTQQIEQDTATKVTVAQTSLEDTMAIVGCSERSASCLTRVAQALEVDYIVYGSAAPGDTPDTFAITLVVARRSGDVAPVEHRFSVQVAEVQAAESAFAAAAPAGFLRATKAIDQAQPAPPAAAPDSGNRSLTFDVDRVEQTSWIVTGTGGALVGAGVVFWLLASSSQSDVNDHAVDSPADFDRLVELEDRTSNRAIIGNVLVLAGTATAVVGAVLAVRQGLVREEPAITVTPMANGDSVGISLSIGWPR
jgi:hypothetical protein